MFIIFPVMNDDEPRKQVDKQKKMHKFQLFLRVEVDI